MKNTIKILGIIALVAVIGFSMPGCNRGKAASGDSAPAATSVTETPAPVAAGTGGGAVDRLLDEYEMIVNEYVEMIQKMMAGDMTAAAQAEALEARAEAMGDRFDSLDESDFTPAQMQRYLELTQRVTSAFGQY